MVEYSLLLALGGILVALTLYLYERSSSSRHLALPPGPKGIPFLGNVFDLPTSRDYEVYEEWGRKYGDVVHVSALGKDIIILNSVEAAKDLLDYRSSIYSDRPFIPMLHERSLMDSGWSLTFRRYLDPAWKRHRRLFLRLLNPIAARRFHERQLTSTHVLLRSLLRSPTYIEPHLRHTASSIIMGIAYGYDVQPKNDPFVELAQRMVKEVSQGVNPGAYLVNVFPWLKYIPAWVPGNKFKSFAARARKSGQDLVRVPFEQMKQRIKDGKGSPSFASNGLEELVESPNPGKIQDLMEVAATIYGAASDTTVSSVYSTILCLALNPEIQHRARGELDGVIGSPNSPTFRLPTFEDRPNLPYIDAIVTESLRWMTAVPTGIPHATIEEDEYHGWRIPKGSIVIANSWAMLHNEKTYPDPFVFRPERFLQTSAKGPDIHPGDCGAFGFGRRKCPGRYLADTSVWIEIVSLIAAFTILPGKDKNGEDIDISYAKNPPPALLLHPQQFPCSIKVRSKEVEKRIFEACTADM